jgi:threonylcarbamoyladenosine tRNA methylthiotransferase MtaB
MNMHHENISHSSNFETNKTVSFHTMGCRLNFSESGSVAQGFLDRGYQVVDFGEPADVVFLNTCTVTDQADSSCRNLIRRAVASSPEGKIVVAGCYAQMEPEAIKNMDGVDLVLGTSEKYKVFDYLDEDKDVLVSVDHSQDFWGAATSLASGQTRAFLKVQDGCNYICSFCIIPFARGRSRTISLDEARKQAESLVAQGFQEIVITGVNIGEYEAKSGHRLTDLLQTIASVAGLKRLRLSSVEPNTLSEDVVKCLSDLEIYQNHFHIPLQSGSDEILKLMRRKYVMDDYKQVLERVHKYFPKAAIGADIIVGHPGETDLHFDETFQFLQDFPITHFHVFPFSRRKGTTAAKLPAQVGHQLKKERARALMNLGEVKLAQFAKSHINEVEEVLFESKNSAGRWKGYTSSYLSFETDAPVKDKNTIHRVLIKDSYADGSVSGEILS